MAGVDVMGQAQTGTGKTAAFAIPILERLKPHRKAAPPQALVLVPTRELAVQVRDECVKLADGRHVHIVAVYGGKPIRNQIEQLNAGGGLRRRARPGRRAGPDRAAARWCSASVQFVVLDEADRMLDIGFRPDIEKILRRCPQSRQTMLLSATMPPPVEAAGRALHARSRVAGFLRRRTWPSRPSSSSISPSIRSRSSTCWCGCWSGRSRGRRSSSAARSGARRRSIAGWRTKFKGVDTHPRRLAAERPRPRDGGVSASGKIRWLVATDVVGRGIDVTSISHIINYDIPQFCDDYVHRVGRTGRMGREGVAYTFVTPEEGNELTRIEMRINRLLIRDEMAGMAVLEKPEASGEVPADALDEEGQPIKAARCWYSAAARGGSAGALQARRRGEGGRTRPPRRKQARLARRRGGRCCGAAPFRVLSNRVRAAIFHRGWAEV